MCWLQPESHSCFIAYILKSLSHGDVPVGDDGHEYDDDDHDDNDGDENWQ